MATFTLHSRIGDIVTQFPKASEIFRKYQVDFCCGGHRPLAEAVTEKKLDGGKLLQELNSAYHETKALSEGNVDWQSQPLSVLMEHIVNTHHVYLQKTLPEVSNLVTMVLRAHGSAHGELAKVHRLFHMLKLELEQHLIAEEEVIFPLIQEYESSGDQTDLEKLRQGIDQLESEHNTAGDVLKELRSLTRDYAAPDDACPTYINLYRLMEELEGDIFQHIHLENNILHQRIFDK